MELQISRKQHLTDILPEIPANTILHKKITGCGATYGEIKAHRNSIIVEPNVPVIIGKCEKHQEDNLFGVYEGVYTTDVIKYLGSIKQDAYIKLMTTPESFPKIKDAFEETGMSIYDCFLLFDECHKIIKDIDYREDITAPFDDFFDFPDKALVSATPIGFSDPRFARQNFQTIEIIPDYDIVKEINLYPTNNVLETLKRLLNQFAVTNRPLCFFINSTDMIYSIMEQLHLLEESAVFCAPKSVNRLKDKKFTEAYTDWKPERMKKYNFFTSRFYCALDIELEEQPELIMLTDVYTAEYTMIDPYTDAIQIIGRFRNGVHSVSHISNFSNKLPQNSPEELREQVTVMENIYSDFRQRYDYATSKVHRKVFYDTLQTLPFRQFLNKSGEKDYNKIDNYVNENKVLSYYYSKDTFQDAYDNCNLFYTLAYTTFMYCLGDCEKLKREDKSLTMKQRRKILVAQLEMLGDCETKIEREQKNELRFADALTVDAYDLLGKEELERLDYSLKRIKEAMILKRYSQQVCGTEFQLLIKNSFAVRQRYPRSFIKEELIRIYGLLGIQPRKNITANLIQDFFETKECWMGKKEKRERGILLIRPKI